MSTKKIREALRKASNYIGDRSAASAPFWDALVGAEAELDDLAIQKADMRTALRDAFAAAALTGLMANPSTSGLLPDASKAHCLAARIAYASADAMLAAREGK